MSKETFDVEKFNNLKKDVDNKYRKIGKIYCPALKSDVVFNSDGLHHLRYDNTRSERSKNSQRGKFMCFNDAVCIIKKSTTVQEYRRSICPIGNKDKSGFRKTKTVEWFGMFAIISFTRKIRINTIVRRIGEDSGNYHFWSVIPYWTISNTTRTVGSQRIEDG